MLMGRTWIDDRKDGCDGGDGCLCSFDLLFLFHIYITRRVSLWIILRLLLHPLRLLLPSIVSRGLVLRYPGIHSIHPTGPDSSSVA